jgi:hypothetical protein
MLRGALKYNSFGLQSSAGNRERISARPSRPGIVARIFFINAIAFARLLILHRTAAALLLLRQQSRGVNAAA